MFLYFLFKINFTVRLSTETLATKNIKYPQIDIQSTTHVKIATRVNAENESILIFSLLIEERRRLFNKKHFKSDYLP